MAEHTGEDAPGQGVLFLAEAASSVRGSSKVSPKRPRTENSGLADIFPYYAGFSFDWAVAELREYALDGDSIVFDPWNGSGTTTLAARVLGLASVGVDRNPVANMVARLRLDVGSAATTAKAPRLTRRDADEADPLLLWFCPASVSRIRDWTTKLRALPHSEVALTYVALFNVVRALTSRFEGSNPTWVRRTATDRPAVSFSPKEFDDHVNMERRRIAKRISGTNVSATPSVLVTGSSKNLPLANESVSRVITSPPYLTRIDYAVAYSRELAILGVNAFEDRRMRGDLMGTTLIRQEIPTELELGDEAASLIKGISEHESWASGGYYLKQARQYFDDLLQSLDEITRVCRPGTYMTLVVQDSYYKEIPIRLGRICREEASLRGWQFVRQIEFPVIRSLVSVNRNSRQYPKARVSETAVTLRKS